MPKLWNETIEAHRREVRDAILDAADALIGEHGLLSVTMSRIASRTGIGRATLYKYFPDVEAIVRAWHHRQIAEHLETLTALGDQAGDVGERLEAVLHAYALIAHQRAAHEHPGASLAAALHQGAHVGHAEHHVHAMLTALLAEAARAGRVRDDVAADELAGYCLHALGGAADLRTEAAVRRLVEVTRAGLRPPSPT